MDLSHPGLARRLLIPDHKACPRVSGASLRPQRRPPRSSAAPSADTAVTPARGPGEHPSGAETTS